MEFFKDAAASVSRMEIVETGSRRRFSDAAKVAIVAESYRGGSHVTATARRHGITRYQLYGWRKAFEEGRLIGSEEVSGFVPALVVPETEPVVAAAVRQNELAALSGSSSRRMEVVSANGRRVILDWDGEVDGLLQVVRGLETL